MLGKLDQGTSASFAGEARRFVRLALNRSGVADDAAFTCRCPHP